MKQSGHLMKMRGKLNHPVEYSLMLDDIPYELNSFLGKKITLNYSGEIRCIATGEKIKKSYNQGYSYKAFMTLPECDICIVKPELCHFDQGTCRDSKWGEEHCFQPHYLYLAFSSELKVGITRKKQVPTRFIDQGALCALPILEFQSRRDSGIMENELKAEYSDKTNWRLMLSDPAQLEFDPESLREIREEIYDGYGDLIDQLAGIDLEHDLIEIDYPVLQYPKKITSLSFDKKPKIEGVLWGIKGQYLILDTGVINMRKHQGYKIDFQVDI